MFVKVGPYRDLQLIGRGGMGVVFKARDSRDGRTVAVKTIKALSSGEQRARLALVREASTAATLSHPNIVKVFDVGQQGGVLYIVMEYLDGVPLSHLIRQPIAGPEARFALSRRLDVIRQVCLSLHYAHERGVIHQDIKPANIFVLPDGSAKILDFGISAVSQIATGIAGTPPYMSPEQITGREIGPPSDVWAAGVTLYELLRARLPFGGQNLYALYSQILNSEFPALPPALPFSTELTRVLAHALNKDVARRYHSARALAAVIESLISAVERYEESGPLELENSSAEAVEANEASSETVTDSDSFLSDLGSEVHSRPALDSVFVDKGVNDRSAGAHANLPINREEQEGFRSGYLLPNLHFRRAASRQVRLEKPGKPSKYMLFLLLPGFGVPALAFYEVHRALAQAYLYPAQQQNRPALEVSNIGNLIIFASFAASIAVFWLASVAMKWWQRALSCPACRLPMAQCSDWLAYPRTPQEDALMRRDCQSAIQSGAWVEATNLFMILGRNVVWGVAPDRYELRFYECVECGEHAAKLSLWHMLNLNRDGAWSLKEVVFVAYAGRGRLQIANLLLNPLRRIAQLPGRHFFAIPGTTKAGRPPGSA